jgi:hypothetical protein
VEKKTTYINMETRAEIDLEDLMHDVYPIQKQNLQKVGYKKNEPIWFAKGS